MAKEKRTEDFSIPIALIYVYLMLSTMLYMATFGEIEKAFGENKCKVSEKYYGYYNVEDKICIDSFYHDGGWFHPKYWDHASAGEVLAFILFAGGSLVFKLFVFMFVLLSMLIGAILQLTVVLSETKLW